MVIYKLYVQRTGTKFLKTKQYIYNMWQPSLVLGNLGTALWVPQAFSVSILGLALQP